MKNNPGNGLKKEFREYYLLTSLPTMKTGLMITLGLFLSYAAINIFFFPGQEEQKFFMRFGIIFPYIIASLIVISIKSLRKQINVILTIINLLAGIAVFIVGATAGPHVKGYEYYFSWVSLVILGIHTFYRIRLLNLIVVGIIMLLSYVGATIYNQTITTHPEIFLNNLFFILGMSVIGFFISYIIHYLSWKDFLQQKEISKSYHNLVTEIKQKELAESALVQKEKLYRESLDSIPDLIHVVDRDMRLVLINTSVQKKHMELGLTMDVIGKDMFEVYSFLGQNVRDEMEMVFNSGKEYITQEKTRLNGVDYYTETRKIPVFENYKVVQVMTIVRDISKKMELEELKQRSAAQKDIMLKEIHHRVKNNMAIIISLLSLQIRNNPNPEIIKTIRDIELRIRSMALIHEHLYKSDNLDRIPLANYLQSLISIISSTYRPKNIRMVNELESMDVSLETAMPLGLITNELLTNGFKYGFPEQKEGEIRVTLKSTGNNDGSMKLTIKDNGIGLPADFSLEHKTTMGLFIVRILVEQINAELLIESKGGASFSIIFKEMVMEKDKLPIN